MRYRIIENRVILLTIYIELKRPLKYWACLCDIPKVAKLLRTGNKGLVPEWPIS